MAALPQHDLQVYPKLFSRVLVPTDFSGVSRRAFLNALALAARLELQVYLAHVLTHAPLTDAAAARLAAVEQLKEFTTPLPPGAPLFIPLVEEGQLWDAVDQLVHRHSIDLLVLGTHGLASRPQPFGSGAEQIFRHATCPVLTIGPSTAAQDLSQVQFHRILFVTDFGPSAERAAVYAISLARKYSAALTALHVVETPEAASRLELDHLRQIHTQHMRQSLHALDRTFVAADFCVRFGTPAEEILHGAQESPADLIVMGSKATGSGWAGHVPLSTAYNVVAKAPCPVLTVRAGRPHSHYVSSPSD